MVCFIRIKYPIACGRGPQNLVSDLGPSLGFDWGRGRRVVGIHFIRKNTPLLAAGFG
jgi:hypothetical protein